MVSVCGLRIFRCSIFAIVAQETPDLVASSN